MIIAKNINLSFDKNKVIFKDFSFEISENQHVCFAGASGKGKSSVLKLLQGYIIPQAGKIEIDKIELNSDNISEIRSLISYIPQNINLPVKNGNELIKMLSVESKQNKISKLIIDLGLEKNFLERSFDEISGGQKQRLIVAVCLSLDRKIILMDEPTASLDFDSTQKIISVIKNLSNKTIVSASHNPDWISATNKTINL